MDEVLEKPKEIVAKYKSLLLEDVVEYFSSHSDSFPTNAKFSEEQNGNFQVLQLEGVYDDSSEYVKEGTKFLIHYETISEMYRKRFSVSQLKIILSEQQNPDGRHDVKMSVDEEMKKGIIQYTESYQPRIDTLESELIQIAKELGITLS